MEWNEILPLALRLLIASVLGALIGYERELRAKTAGVRTHVMVALGAAMFMIVSQFGFAGAERFDAARIAAGVVTGIGFIGGGIIMRRSHVSGLTTAATLWVTGSVGLAAGSGLYVLAAILTLMVLFCLEAMNMHTFRLGVKEVSIVLTADKPEVLTETAKALGMQLQEFSLSRQGERYQASFILLVPKKVSMEELLRRLNGIPGVRLESLE